MSLTIFHNPKCSKSRESLALLQQHNIQPEIVLYLEHPLDVAALTQLHQQLACEVTDMLRFKEELAKELGISAKDARGQQEWLQILANHPRLLERPIVTDGKRAVIGRPPENVLALI